MVCQISWIQIQWQKNQICFCYKWSRELNTLCLESPLQCRRKRTSSGFWLELNGGSPGLRASSGSGPGFPVRSLNFSQYAYYPWVGGTKWSTASTTLPRNQFSRCPMRTDFLYHACQPLGSLCLL